ncbi:putative Dihydrolipoamide dehydrogenase [Paraburkholderia tropica]
MGPRTGFRAQPVLLSRSHAGHAAVAARTREALRGRRAARRSHLHAALDRARHHLHGARESAHRSEDRRTVSARLQPDRARSRHRRRTGPPHVGRAVARAREPDSLPLPAPLHAVHADEDGHRLQRLDDGRGGHGVAARRLHRHRARVSESQELAQVARVPPQARRLRAHVRSAPLGRRVALGSADRGRRHVDFDESRHADRAPRGLGLLDARAGPVPLALARRRADARPGRRRAHAHRRRSGRHRPARRHHRAAGRTVRDAGVRRLRRGLLRSGQRSRRRGPRQPVARDRRPQRRDSRQPDSRSRQRGRHLHSSAVSAALGPYRRFARTHRNQLHGHRRGDAQRDRRADLAEESARAPQIVETERARAHARTHGELIAASIASIASIAARAGNKKALQRFHAARPFLRAKTNR